jgi:hypothetical protein
MEWDGVVGLLFSKLLILTCDPVCELEGAWSFPSFIRLCGWMFSFLWTWCQALFHSFVSSCLLLTMAGLLLGLYLRIYLL